MVRKRRRKNRLINGFLGISSAKFTGYLTVFVLIMASVFLVFSYFTRNIRGESRYSLALFNQAHELLIFSKQPEMQESTIVFFGDRSLLPLINGYGEYKVGVLEQLLEIEQKKLDLISKSLRHWLGITVYQTLTDAPIAVETNNLNIHFSGTQLFQFFISKGLNVFDAATIVKDFSWNSEYLINEIDAESTYGNLQRLPTGQHEFAFDDKSLNTLSLEYLQDQSVRNNSPQLAVINATQHSGLAKQAAQVLSRYGLDVVRILDERDEFSENKLLVDSSLKGTYDFNFISNSFLVTPEYKKGVLDKYTVPVVLIVTQEYYDLLYEE